MGTGRCMAAMSGVFLMSEQGYAGISLSVSYNGSFVRASFLALTRSYELCRSFVPRFNSFLPFAALGYALLGYGQTPLASFVSRKDNQQRYAGDHQQGGNDLGLCRMEAEDIIPGIDPDLFHEEPFDAIDDNVESE
jgi:hypothetical protein